MTTPDSSSGTEVPSNASPSADVARQAIHALRGYAYQALATALAWIDLDDRAKVFIEVAEDYAVVADNALRAVQVKDTKGSGSITLNTGSVREAVATFVDLAGRNSDAQVHLRYLTTSEIGQERLTAHRPAGVAGLEYWHQAAVSPRLDLLPLRQILESERFPTSVRAFCQDRDNAQLRRDLIERIRWDCGKPDISTLRQELEARLVVVGRDKFGVPAQEARSLADTLLYRVLKTAVAPATENRVLNRADLYDLIDATTRLSVPRRSFDLKERIDSALGETLRSLVEASSAGSVAEVGWLIAGSTLPPAHGLLRRTAAETAVTQSLEDCGAAVAVGASGLGKSLLCQTVATARSGAFSLVEFRGTTAAEARSRLDLVFGYLGELPPGAVILDDIHHLEDGGIIVSLGRILSAASRRGQELMLTCYIRPAATTLARLNLPQHCVVTCEYFSQAEVDALVRQHGGAREQWGRVAYFSGGIGHPQLTHAFIVGVAARGWPRREVGDVVGRGFMSPDVAATQDGARRTLMAAVPPDARTLLYRLSLAVGRFDRAIALSVGAVEPAVARTGEHLDLLIGPWIEHSDVDSFRVSPLAGRWGGEMLDRDEQRNTHESIATRLLARRSLTVQDANAIFIHGMAGKSRDSMARLAWAILTANAAVREALAEHLVLFRLRLSSEPFYAEDGMVSVALRMAQFKLATANGDRTWIAEVAAALLRESRELPDDGRSGHLRTLAQVTVLSTINIGSYFEDWVDVLVDFAERVKTAGVLEAMFRDVEGAPALSSGEILGGLFSIGSAQLESLDQLERIVERLDGVDADTRARLLRPIHEASADYAVLINEPWTRYENNPQALDSGDAVKRYRRIAEVTQGWGVPELTMQCFVAWSIVLDQFEGDAPGAEAVLHQAIATFGRHWILCRRLAKVHLRRGAFEEAFRVFREIAPTVGGGNAVERAFALRDAAISAASCGEWARAEGWFGDAQMAAEEEDLEDMRAMAVGLGADAGIAALEGGRHGVALERLVAAVEDLGKVEASGGLRGAHCHLAVRHAVVAVSWRLGQKVRSDAEAPGPVEPGTCSNPSPAREVLERPVPHIDLSWYLLAEADVAGGLALGVAANLHERLEDGPIPLMEVRLRLMRIARAVDEGNAGEFARWLGPYYEAAGYAVRGSEEDWESPPPTWLAAPERDVIPAWDGTGMDQAGERAAEHAIVGFGLRAAMAREMGWLGELVSAIEGVFGAVYPGKALVGRWEGAHEGLSEMERQAILTIRGLMGRKYTEPIEFVKTGLYFFDWINVSPLKHVLWPRLAAWQVEGWRKIVASDRFRLVRPRYAVPVIEAALAGGDGGRGFIARVLLTGCDAVGLALSTEYRERLRGMGWP